MVKEGYAYEKALLIIAWEKGEIPKPKLPSNRALMGAINSWKTKIEAGYFPKSKASRKIYFRTAAKFDFTDKRPFMQIEGQYHSKRIGNTIYDLIMGFSLLETMKRNGSKGSPSLIDFDEDKEEKLRAIAEDLVNVNDPKIWNLAFKNQKLKVKVWYQGYLPR